MTSHKILLISGALRQGSTNRQLLREAARLFDGAGWIEADLNLPLYDGDLESDEGIPKSVETLAAQIAVADGVVISTPEYNKAPSGVLKNALDWVSRLDGNPWADKPVALMSAAAGRAGGEVAQMLLRGFLTPFQPRIIAGPALHLGTSFQEFDEAGQLKSAQYAQTLQQLMQNLRQEIARK